MRDWLGDFLREHPEYQERRIVRRTAHAAHFEVAPGLVEAHVVPRPRARQPVAPWWTRFNPLATVDTFQPGAAGEDTHIYANNAATNYGNVNIIRAGNNYNLGYRLYRGLLRLDISSIPGGATASVATLTLQCVAEPSATDYAVAVHRALVQWYEGDGSGVGDRSTWGHRNDNGDVHWGQTGGKSGTDYAAGATATTTITGTGSFNWNVLADVSAWLAGTATNYGWFLLGDEGTIGYTYKDFASGDHATASYWPKLVVTYTVAGAGARSFAVWVG